MRIVIAGGHGKIALRLERQLAARGDRVTGLIRDPAQTDDVRSTGADAAVCDLEQATVEEAARILDGADAAVFAAGAGPGSGAARKDSLDRGGSALLAEAAQRAGVRRFVQISSAGAGQPPRPGADEVWRAYIAAKTAAEEDLRARDLDWTVLRPGILTEGPGSGLVALTEDRAPGAQVQREDVAAVIAALLRAPYTAGRTLELIGGRTPVEDAVAAFRPAA